LSGAKIKGIYTQGLASGTFFLEPGKTQELSRPQTPKAPFPYLQEECEFMGEVATMSGTLTLPKSDNLHPTIILVSGSGPQDRDETMFLHKPFLVIADYLTKRGFAVFRYDDRGVKQSKGDFSKASSFNFAKDAKAALNYLLSRKDLDPNKIGMIGHSEGATIANIIASEAENRLAFIVMMAGMGVSGQEVLSFQRKQGFLNQGIDLKFHHKNEEIFQVALENLITKLSQENIIQKMMPKANAYADILKKELKKEVDALKYAQSIFGALSSPWMRVFLFLDPVTYLSKIQIPVLVMNGILDQQVDIGLNMPSIRRALKLAGNKRVSFELLPGLNHLFQKAETGAVSEYQNIEETINVKALEVLNTWLQKQVK
ncbi:alpha/beta fold hydrolase, partial [bacterium]|nr:alpha/beta fold hydrolase [bacterium]